MSRLRCKSLKFLAMVPKVTEHGGCVNNPLATEYKLGVGPCGLYVYDLSVSFEGEFMHVVQHADNRMERRDSVPDLIEECKVFTYPVRDIIGRVEQLAL